MTRAGALVAIGLISSAQSGGCLDQATMTLNQMVQLMGPFAGSVVDEIPQPQADEEQAAAGYEMSNGWTNTPNPEHANQFAFEGSGLNTGLEVTGTYINLDNLNENSGGLDVPTGSSPSPLFGAQPFTQQMLRFEEFGPTPMAAEADVVELEPFPAPSSAEGFPDWEDLDDFLKQYTTASHSYPYPYPTRMANDPDNGGSDENPWKPEIEAYLGRELNSPPAEGRPPGEHWGHQRYEEFFPKVYFSTVQTGARDNTGFRDDLQFHRYQNGEFAAGGLYHNTTGNPGSEGTTAGVEVRFHPNFPVQDPRSLWTFDGTFPPKLLQTRYGESVMMRHYNGLPIDPSSNYGFGSHTITTHEHNGHNPAESDGYTQAFFFPGQFYDYHWPMIIAGHDSINTTATDPRAGSPDGHGGITNLPGDWRETMSTHWFHDHMLDFTATNVYKGNAAMMNYYSSLDRGHETLDDGVNLRFPSGSALDWGNRDYDVNLFIKGIAWDSDGQLFFNIFNTDGMLGDQLVTNWLWKPHFDVRARRYRFRILNGSVSRYIKLAVVEQVQGAGGEFAGPPSSGVSYNAVPFYMIANDGNIMEHAVYFDGNKTVGGLTNRKGTLPTQGIAERYDIVVDFGQFPVGTKLYMVNLLEHHNGRRPHQEIPLAEVLAGNYEPEVKDGRNQTDPTVTRFLEFRVQPWQGPDPSMNPADFVEGKQTMIPLPGFTQAELDNATHRTFDFGRSSGTDSAPWTIKTDGGAGFNMDPRRLSAAPNNAKVEIWHLNGNGGWSHPIHVHFEEGQILKRGGVEPPEWEKWARKDVYRIGRLPDSTESVEFAIRFREFLGSYMEHCHNTQHEDHAMLLRWDIENPGQVRVMPTPMPSWDGVGYVPSYALPTFRSGDLAAAAGEDPEAPEEEPATAIDQIVVDKSAFRLDKNRWRVAGESSVVGPDNTVIIHLGPTVDAPAIGTALVDALGEWEFDEVDSSNPPGTQTQISVSSSANGVLEGIAIEFE